MYPYFDIFSLILYVTIGILGAICINFNINNSSKYLPNSGYLWFYIIFIILATFRFITYGIVGTDSLNYKALFETCLTGGGRFEEQDILFLYLTKFIRSLTSNYIIYEYICYSIIILGYIVFIRNNSKKGISCIPFILIIIPYLKSLNTMRSSIAIAIFLMGLVLISKKHHIFGIVVILCTLLIHRMSIIYVLIIPFYYIIKPYLKKLNDSKLICISIIISCISYFIASKFQQYAIAINLLDGTDAYYISKNVNGSIFDSAITILPLVLLCSMWWICRNRIQQSYIIEFLKILIIFDIIVTPAANLLGMWRANEYMYIPRLIFWAYLIVIFCSYFKKSNIPIIKYTFTILFTLWLGYRILKEWEPCGLMPYLTIWN